MNTIESTIEPAAPRDLGAYRLLGVLDHDDELAVCAAVHRQSGGERLVKLLLPGAFPGGTVRRFLRRARALTALGHPALPATHESGRLPSGAAFVVTEPVVGEPADAWLLRAGNLGANPAVAAAAVAAVAEICAGLERTGLVHGDLRPATLRLLPADGARFTVGVAGLEEAICRSGPASAPYRAPERWQGRPPDRRSDIYALGCLFFELLAGTPPFGAADQARLRAAHLRQPVPRIADVLPALSIQMQRLLGRMLAKDPDVRYQSMGEIVAALELSLGRHHARFAELLTTPCPPRAVRPRSTADLSAVAAALDESPPDAWMAEAVRAMNRLGASAREAAIRGLVSLRRTPAAGSAPTVLVAEDDDDTRQSLIELLEENGYRVIAARHGREAQEYLRRGQRAECMLMDLWMPEMDGWALADEMKAGRLPSVPTIVMTAAEPHWGYPSGIVVRKPFDSRHLIGLIRTVSTPRSGVENGADPPPS